MRRIHTLFYFLLISLSTNALSGQNTSLNELIQRYIEAQGGEEAVESVKALRLEGTISNDNMELPFVQFKKTPNLMRTILEFPNYQLITGYNGQVAWYKANLWDYSVKLAPAETEATAISASLFSQLYILRDKPERLRLLGSTEVDGVLCYEVAANPLNSYADITYFISSETYFEKKVVILSTISDRMKRTEINYTDNQKVAPLTIPFKITTYENGKIVNTISIEKATVNPGVYDNYFNPPGELLDKPRQPPSQED